MLAVIGPSSCIKLCHMVAKTGCGLAKAMVHDIQQEKHASGVSLVVILVLGLYLPC